MTSQQDSIFVSQHGLRMNQNNGIYQNGAALPIEKKLLIAMAYTAATDEAHGCRPNISELATKCNASRSSIVKVEEELFAFGRVLDPKEIRADSALPQGPGTLSLDEADVFVILMLYHQEPSRNSKSYVDWLRHLRGTVVDKSTISRFFTDGFHIRGSFCKPNLIPVDKFRPANVEKAYEYLVVLSMFDRARIKYCDEKHLKGAELFCQKTRRNVLTGEVLPVLTDSDFRNTYSIVGFCGIDERVTPVRHAISQGINDAENFSIQVEGAIRSGWLLPFDCLVADNAAIHSGKENEGLEEWLWDKFRIFMLFLPARTPEWNPIELVWNILVQRLKTIDLCMLRKKDSHSVVWAASAILNDITHHEVDKCYRHCGI